MKNTIVFALSSSVGLAEDICKELGLELGCLLYTSDAADEL